MKDMIESLKRSEEGRTDQMNELKRVANSLMNSEGEKKEQLKYVRDILRNLEDENMDQGILVS